MEWSGDAIVLSARKYGEADALVDVLAQDQGRYRGYVRGGMGRRQRGVLQAGNAVSVTWRARLEANMGNLTLELREARASQLFDQPAALAALTSATALLLSVLPEREPHPRLYEAFGGFLDFLCGHPAESELWGAALVKFEVGLLGELGFGLDLSACAATGETENLIYVSPRSGRAVSEEGGRPYKEKLLPLPAFLIGGGGPEAGDIRAGFTLSGFFLERHVLGHLGRTMPESRARLLSYFED